MSELDPTPLMELIKTRRSIRQFTDQPVPRALLEQIVEAGVWAPTGSNRQEVRFQIVTDPQDVRALWEAKPHIKNPQAAIMVYADLSDPYYADLSQRPHTMQLPLLDIGAACQNMLLAAHALGLGACWVSISPYWHRGRPVFKRFETDPQLRLGSVILLGYPARLPDLATTTHAGKPVQRADPAAYQLTPPPITRVLVLHSLPRDRPNLGAQALSEGLRRAVHARMGETPIGILGRDDPHLRAYTKAIHALINLEPNEALIRFNALVEQAVGDVLRAVEIPDRPFAESLHTFLTVPRRAIALWRRGQGRWRQVAARLGRGARRARYSRKSLSDPWVPDPLFGLEPARPPLALGAGIVLKDRELRPRAQMTPAEARVYQWAQRLHHRLSPFFAAPLVPGPNLHAQRLFAWAQVVLLDGDGHIADPFRDAALRSFFDLALAKALGAAAYSVNQTVDIAHPVLRRLARAVYNRIDGVIVREPQSVQALEELGVRASQITLAADCAILADERRDAEADRLMERFGVPEGAIGLVLRGDMAPDLDYWTRAVQQIEAQTGRKVIILSSCEQDDLPFGRQLGQATGATVIEGLTDYALFISFVRHLSLVITQRYHPLYFSLMAGVPILPLLGNTFKARGLLQHFEYPADVLDAPALETLIDSVMRILADSEAIRARIPAIRERLRELAWQNVHMLPAQPNQERA